MQGHDSDGGQVVGLLGHQRLFFKDRGLHVPPHLLAGLLNGVTAVSAVLGEAAGAAAHSLEEVVQGLKAPHPQREETPAPQAGGEDGRVALLKLVDHQDGSNHNGGKAKTSIHDGKACRSIHSF